MHRGLSRVASSSSKGALHWLCLGALIFGLLFHCLEMLSGSEVLTFFHFECYLRKRWENPLKAVSAGGSGAQACESLRVCLPCDRDTSLQGRDVFSPGSRRRALTLCSLHGARCVHRDVTCVARITQISCSLGRSRKYLNSGVVYSFRSDVFSPSWYQLQSCNLPDVSSS